ncbi:MAG: endonuclease/exonuclease/phosphatase family protein [Clostridia bacterium]|nr:endonuclease/exonuclease/phosphatase family protein [Clostridia bacterium]
MKKIILSVLCIIFILSVFTSCSKNEAYIEPIFPTVESVNATIDILDEVNDIKSAALVSEILEDYRFLSNTSKAKVKDIQRVIDSIETATTYLEDGKISVMSFNVRYAEFTPDRIDRVVNLILQEYPDVVGMQEVTDEWKKVLGRRLAGKYEILGHGRDEDKTGEAVCILYKTESFNLLESNTLWLTDTPEVYSKHPDSNQERIFTYQLLERKTDGQIFLHVNMHLDHKGETARVYQSQIVTSWIEETFGHQYPTVLTGDFNDYQDSEPLKTFFDAEYEVMNAYGENVRTFQGYNDDPNAGGIIDFIFINDFFVPVSYKVCPEKMDGEWISDHNAIVSELLLIPTYDSIEIPTEDTEE